MNTAARINSLVTQPDTEASARAAAARPSTAWQICSSRRRSERSATWPATSIKAAEGKNCMSPISPRSKALPVSEYICQATATPSIWKPMAAQVRALQ
jgi:hypothetical protein